MGQLSPIDLVVLLILSEALQEALTDNDRSLVGGAILAATLVFWHFVVSWITFKSEKVKNVLEGVPVVLVQDGVPDEDAMRAERVPQDEILSEARQVGIENMDHIHKAVLETSGKISIIPKAGNFRTAAPPTKELPD